MCKRGGTDAADRDGESDSHVDRSSLASGNVLEFEGCSVDSESCADSTAAEVALEAESWARRSPRCSFGSFGAERVGHVDASDDLRPPADADGAGAVWCYWERSYASAWRRLVITDLNFRQKVADSVCMVEEREQENVI